MHSDFRKVFWRIARGTVYKKCLAGNSASCLISSIKPFSWKKQRTVGQKQFVYHSNNILVSPKPFWQHGCEVPLRAHGVLLLLDMADLNLSNFINLTVPGRCRQLSLLSGCAVPLHHIPHLLLGILKIFYVSPNFWPSGFKTTNTVNHFKQSITNQEPPAYECVCNNVFV